MPRAKSGGKPAEITRARAFRVMGSEIANAPAGTPIPFVLSTPGVKRDGINLAGIPFSLERYQTNPVVLANHDYDNFPIGRGNISSVQTRSGEALIAEVEFDLNDPLGALADSKVRNGFLHAVSIGWSDVDAQGVPTSVSGRKVAAHEILEFSLVSVPADPDALVSIGGRSYKPVYLDVSVDDYDYATDERGFLEAALPVADDDQIEMIEDSLRRLGVCSGEVCRNMATQISDNARGGDDTGCGAQELDATDQIDGPGADDPDTGEARVAAVKAAMLAALWVDPGQNVDDNSRKRARDACIPHYRRLGLVPPVMLPASVCASLPYERQAALFVNGEADMSNAKVEVTVRKGAKISGERLTTLADARASIEEGLSRLNKVISDVSADRSAPKAAVALGDSEMTEEARLVVDELSKVYPGRVGVSKDSTGKRMVWLDLWEVGEVDSPSEMAVGPGFTMDQATIDAIAAQVAAALAAGDLSVGYSKFAAMPEFGEEPGAATLMISIDTPGAVDIEAIKAAVLASLAGGPSEIAAPEVAPVADAPAADAPAADATTTEAAPTGTAGVEPDGTAVVQNNEDNDIVARLKALLDSAA